jgi:hypothetical protein
MFECDIFRFKNTDSMVQRHFSEEDIFSAAQKNVALLWNPRVLHHPLSLALNEIAPYYSHLEVDSFIIIRQAEARHNKRST